MRSAHTELHQKKFNVKFSIRMKKLIFSYQNDFKLIVEPTYKLKNIKLLGILLADRLKPALAPS